MEAQLQQSIPKKTHQEVVAKMQLSIDGLTAELERTKADLQKTQHIEEDLKSLSEQVTTQTQSITSQWQSNDAKKIQELEEKINGMVDRTEYLTIQGKYEELKASTVPKVDYLALQNQFSNFVPRESFEEMQKRVAQTTVPREQYLAAEARMQELEAKIANSVPRSDHEELIASITSMIGEAPHPSETPEYPSAPSIEIAVPAPLVAGQ